MPVTKTEIDVAQQVINLLVGDKAEAEAYADNPAGWLDTHGYGDVSPEALATCGVGSGGAGGGGGGGGAGSAGYAAPPPVSAGAVAQLDYIVYNNYYEDNSITNNIENHGNLDFNQQIAGDNSVNVNDSDVFGDVQAGEGNIQVGGNVNDSNLEAGEGDQLIDDSTNVNAALAFGGDAQAAQAGIGDATNTSAPADGGGDPDPID